MRLQFPKLDPKGIPLKELLAVHRQFVSRKALAENLGDGYLLAYNPIYRNVREEFLRQGFSFTKDDFCDYYAFPLMSLDEVLAAGRIPYRNNVVWLEKLETKAPGLFTLTELKRSELQFNYLFHESAHFVAHRWLFGKRSLKELPKTEATLLGILLGEAFANSVECLSVTFTEGEIGGYFLDANCHFRASAAEAKLLRGVAKRFGYEAVMRHLLGAFLYSNYLYESLSTKQLTLLAYFSGIEARADARKIAKIGLGLNEQFRTTTTQLHLLKLGFPRDLGRVMKIDPLPFLLRRGSANLLPRTAALVRAAIYGLPGADPRMAVRASRPKKAE